jgi:hypothetical protein
MAGDKFYSFTSIPEFLAASVGHNGDVLSAVDYP